MVTRKEFDSFREICKKYQSEGIRTEFDSSLCLSSDNPSEIQKAYNNFSYEGDFQKLVDDSVQNFEVKKWFRDSKEGQAYINEVISYIESGENSLKKLRETQRTWAAQVVSGNYFKCSLNNLYWKLHQCSDDEIVFFCFSKKPESVDEKIGYLELYISEERVNYRIFGDNYADASNKEYIDYLSSVVSFMSNTTIVKSFEFLSNIFKTIEETKLVLKKARTSLLNPPKELYEKFHTDK